VLSGGTAKLNLIKPITSARGNGRQSPPLTYDDVRPYCHRVMMKMFCMACLRLRY